MGEKSQQKKKFIVEKARQVFVDKGYRAVTMKDIIDACEISRGGLYLYFANTQEIFLEVLKQEQERGEDVFSTQIDRDSTTIDILELFFAAQKAELMHFEDSLAVATYEYCFAHRPEGKENFLHVQFEEAVHALAQLLEMGAEAGELYCDDAVTAAKAIMYTLEGLKAASLSMQVPEAEIDRQIAYLLEGFGLEQQ